jgi:hypothetical protein
MLSYARGHGPSAHARPLRRLAAHGVHAGQEYLLEALWQEDGLTIGELASRLGVEVPTVVRTAQRRGRGRGLAYGALDARCGAVAARGAYARVAIRLA